MYYVIAGDWIDDIGQSEVGTTAATGDLLSRDIWDIVWIPRRLANSGLLCIIVNMC